MLTKARVLVHRTKCLIFFSIVFLHVTIVGQIENKKLSLKDAIEIGLKNNPEIRSA